MTKARTMVAPIMPPAALPKTLVLQTFVYSIGAGFYAAGSVIFFTVYTGLSATQVAAGVSAAGLCALLLRLPFGMLADVLGGRMAWLLGALAQAILTACYPLVDSFTTFVIVISLTGLATSLGVSGRGRYLGDAIPAGQRVRSNAYLRSLLNIGMGLGTAGAGFLVAVESRSTIVIIVLANALTLFFDVVLLAFFMKSQALRPIRSKERVRGSRALKDRPFLVLSLINGVLMMSDTVLTVVLPLWILRITDAPRQMIPIVLLINMGLVTLLQVWASAGSEDVPGAARVQRRGGLLFAAACLIVPFSAWTGGPWTWAVVIGTVLVLTLGELYASAAAWGLGYELSPEDRRGEYLAVFGWGGQFAEIVGPAGMTAVALSFIPGGWIIICTVFAVAALATGPVVRWVIRSRSATVPAEPGNEVPASIS